MTERGRLALLSACLVIVLGLLSAPVLGTSRRAVVAAARRNAIVPIGGTAAPPCPSGYRRPPGGRTDACLPSDEISTTEPRQSPAIIPGVAGQPPPCTMNRLGAYAADIAHPEGAPLQAEGRYDGGRRWALCGASLAYSADLLNLRSADDGATWRVTDTGIAFSPHHAGDVLDITLPGALHGTIVIRSPATGSNIATRYTTSDGGLSWTRT